MTRVLQEPPGQPAGSPEPGGGRSPLWRVARVLDPWAPPLALMAVIFYLSAQPDLSSGLGTVDLIGRKIVHAAEYGLLTFLWWRVLRGRTPTTKSALIAAFAIAVTYAATDELHQTFVDGRHGTPVDVLIDSAGASLAALLTWRRAA